jgi:hypothetical protein
MASPIRGGSAVPQAERVTDAFVALADAILSGTDTDALAQLLVRGCVDVVEEVDAGLWLNDQRGLPRLVVVSDEPVRSVELTQLALR